MLKIGVNLTIVCVVALLCVTFLVALALYKGIDGVLLTIAIGLIVGLPTAVITKKITESKKK